MCCSVLQCVAVRCSALLCVAVCCSVLQRVAVCCSGHIIDTCHTYKPNSYCHIPPMCGSSSHTCVTRRLVTRQHTATHCKTLQHTATHCNTHMSCITMCDTSTSDECGSSSHTCVTRRLVTPFVHTWHTWHMWLAILNVTHGTTRHMPKTRHVDWCRVLCMHGIRGMCGWPF